MKPEEQAVAVLASALRANAGFTESVVVKADGVRFNDGSTFTVGTEESTFVGRDHIDLEVVVAEPAQRHVQRVWIEAKLDARLALGERHQLVRYSDALRPIDHRQRHPPLRRLAVLVRRRQDLRDVDLAAIQETGATLLLWQDIADTAWDVGADLAGTPEWRLKARDGDSPLALANLDTLLWYLEDKDFRVNAHQPLFPDSIRHYEHAVQVGEAVGGVARLVAARLSEAGWRTELDKRDAGEPLTFASKPRGVIAAFIDDEEVSGVYSPDEVVRNMRAQVADFGLGWVQVMYDALLQCAERFASV